MVPSGSRQTWSSVPASSLITSVKPKPGLSTVVGVGAFLSGHAWVHCPLLVGRTHQSHMLTSEGMVLHRKTANLSSRGRAQGTGQAATSDGHMEYIQSRMEARVSDVESLQRRGFGLLAITEGNRDMRRDGVGTDNFLEEVGNLFSPECLKHQNGALAIAPSSSVPWRSGGSQGSKRPLALT